MSSRARVFVYGSCVSRDVFTDESKWDVVAYVARQSVISAFGAPMADPDLSGHLDDALPSKFQRRMVRGDLSGSLPAELQAHADSADLVVWDLIDERAGVALVDGGVFTPLAELVSGLAGTDLMRRSARVPFGSPEHFDRFAEASGDFKDALVSLGLLSRTLVVGAFFDASSEMSGAGSVADVNSYLARYYLHLMDLGFRILPVPRTRAVADAAHQWGPAPFHYGESFRRFVEEACSGVLRSMSLESETGGADTSSRYVPVVVREGASPDVRSVSDGFSGFRAENGHYVFRHESGVAVDVRLSGFDGAETSSFLVVFSGAVTPAVTTEGPIFSGEGIGKELDIPVIAVADPAHTLRPRPSVGWYLGTESFDAMAVIVEVVRRVNAETGGNPIFVGGSAGGFAALRAASEFESKSAALVWNAQTKILDYGWEFVDDLLARAFPSLYLKQVADGETWASLLLANRVRADIMGNDTISGLRRVVFLQEESDWHLAAHARPFMTRAVALPLERSGSFRAPGDLAFALGHWGEGHVPPTREMIRTGIERLARSEATAEEVAETLLEMCGHSG